MKYKLKDIAPIFIVTTASLSIFALIAYLSFLAFPSADDFGFALASGNTSPLQNMLDRYQEWNGRFFSDVLIGLFAVNKHLLLYNYYLVPFLIVVANYFAVIHFLKTLGFKTNNILGMSFTFCLTSILLAGYPWRQNLFWLSGGFTYGLATALFIALFTQYYSALTRKDFLLSKNKTVLIAVATFLLAGFNESIMVINVLLLALFLILAIYDKAIIYKKLSWWFCFALTGAAIVYFAPGNAVRSSAFPTPNIVASAAHSLIFVLVQYLVPTICTIIMIYGVLTIFKSEITTKETPSTIFVFLFLCLWSGVFTRYYGLSSPGDIRCQVTDAAIIFIFAPLYAINTYQKKSGSSKILCALVFAITLFIRPTPPNTNMIEIFYTSQYAYALKKYIDSKYIQLSASDNNASFSWSDRPNDHIGTPQTSPFFLNDEWETSTAPYLKKEPYQ